MLRIFCIFMTVTWAAESLPVLAQTPPAHFVKWPNQLQDELMNMYKAGFSGQIHLYVKDTETGIRYTHNASTPTYIASVVKLLFMVELFDQIERGELSLKDYVEYMPDDVRSGSPLFSYLPMGVRLPIKVLVEAMIQQSDNTAADLIANKVGLARINRGLKARGYEGVGQITRLLDVRSLVYGQLDSRILSFIPEVIRSIDLAKGIDLKSKRISELLREAPGYITPAKIDRAYKAYYAQGYNSANMETVGQIFEDLYRGEVVNSTASAAMLDILRGTQTGSGRISAYLPPDTLIAHKTGTQYRRTCDTGLIYLPLGEPVVFAACVKGSTGVKRDEVIARLAYETYVLLTKPHAIQRDARAPVLKPPKKKRNRKKGRKKNQPL